MTLTINQHVLIEKLIGFAEISLDRAYRSRLPASNYTTWDEKQAMALPVSRPIIIFPRRDQMGPLQP